MFVVWRVPEVRCSVKTLKEAVQQAVDTIEIGSAETVYVLKVLKVVKRKELPIVVLDVK